jgi:hypothetical protein
MKKKLKLPTQPPAANQPTWELESERIAFLNLGRFPAIFSVEEAGWFFQFHPDAIGWLVAAGHLPALGTVSLADDHKRFARDVLVQLRSDREWMDRATAIVYFHRKTDAKQANDA